MKRLSKIDLQQVWILSYNFSVPSGLKVAKQYTIMVKLGNGFVQI